MNPYIDRKNEVVTPQPYVLADMTTVSFVVEGDLQAMQALVDRELNTPRNPAPGDFLYRVLLPQALLVFARIGKVASANPPASNHGHGPEIDVAYWLLLGVMQGASLQRLVWYQPFVYVDNPWPLLGGREVYGFNKQLCRPVMPAAPGFNGDFSADTLVLDPFSPGTQQQWKRLITVTRAAPAAGAATAASRPSAADFIRHLLRDHLAPVVPTLHLVESLLKQVLELENTSVFLKQFRDSADPAKACYQAIVEAPIRMTRISGFGVLSGEFQVTQANYDSQPIAQALGLASPQVAADAFWLGFDSVIETGTVVWQA